MENNDLLYRAPETFNQGSPAVVSKHQAIKAMIFGLVALAVAELPYFFGLCIAPPFSIIALCMAADFKRKYPGYATGFIKAAKATAIIALPLAVLISVLSFFSLFAYSMASYYM